MVPHALPRLHLLTDTHLQSKYSHLQLAAAAKAAGANAIQYREKRFDRSQHLAELKDIKCLLADGPTRLIVNDYLDIAVEIGATGVHVGQGDASPALALARLGAGALVGATVHNEAELEAVRHLPLSYIGVGPVFGTNSKDTGLPPLGLDGLARLCNLSPFPVIAIGSIDASTLVSVLEAGAYGVAVLSAFCCAADPEQAARELQAVVDATAVAARWA